MPATGPQAPVLAASPLGLARPLGIALVLGTDRLAQAGWRPVGRKRGSTQPGTWHRAHSPERAGPAPPPLFGASEPAARWRWGLTRPRHALPGASPPGARAGPGGARHPPVLWAPGCRVRGPAATFSPAHPVCLPDPGFPPALLSRRDSESCQFVTKISVSAMELGKPIERVPQEKSAETPLDLDPHGAPPRSRSRRRGRGPGRAAPRPRRPRPPAPWWTL